MQATLELKSFDRCHLDQARRWRNDWRIMAWTRQSEFISDWDQERWFQRQACDQSIRMYAVVLTANGVDRLVGVAGLTSLDWQNRRAEFSLYIGPEHQKNGHGTTALSLLLKHAFENLGLKQVWGETFQNNPAIKTFVKLGMQVDGKRRAFYFKDGQWIDAHLVSILDTEWAERHGKPKSSPADSDRPASGEPSRETIPYMPRGKVGKRAKAASKGESQPSTGEAEKTASGDDRRESASA